MLNTLFTPADPTTVPARPSLFITELDGETFASLEALADWHWDRQAELDAADDYDPDAAYERHLETNDQYRYECEQDELRAAFFGF